MKIDELPDFVRGRIREGTVIPAIPLALDSSRKLDLRHQKALLRYYIDAGAGGLAVGVHTTEFAIRDPEHGLFKPLLSEVSRIVDEYSAVQGRTIVKIGGICGRREQALSEASFLVEQGYHAGLLSLAALKGESLAALIAHAREVAELIPIVGFYLQPDVGGLLLPSSFWRAFAEIENVLAIKIAPFNRYRTIDVARALCEAGREKDIALYTGNDDNIVLDLLTEYKFRTAAGDKTVRMVGGLLGQWCLWTKKAVELHARLGALVSSGADIPASLLGYAAELTDANGAIFDAANAFRGCIPGIHEVLRRQGLLAGTWCLDPDERLSPGQAAEIDRVSSAYPHLRDDDFVSERLEAWLA